MKKKIKRWISVLLMMTMGAMLLAGCGKPAGVPGESGGSQQPGKENNGGSQTQLNKNVIYKREPLNIVFPINDINELVNSGDILYASGNSYDEETWNATFYIFSCQSDGSDMKTIYEHTDEGMPTGGEVGVMPLSGVVESGSVTVEESQGENIQHMMGDGQGNLVLVFNCWQQSGEEYTSFTRLAMLDKDGNELWSEKLPAEMEWIEQAACGGGNILLSCGNAIYVFSTDGKPTGKMETGADIWLSNLLVTEDGRIYGTYYDYTPEMGRFVIVPVDIQAGKLGEPTELPGGEAGFAITAGVGYDLFMQNNLMVVGYNVGDESYTEILNFIDSDIDAGNMGTLLAVAEGEFLMSSYRVEDWSLETSRLTKVAPEDVKEKTILTLGMLWNDYMLTKAVINFNQGSDEYRIRLKEYVSYNTSANPQGGITQLNNDITAGKMPDILVTDNMMPLDSYMEKGAFEDLYTWLDNDAELNREDLMPNVLEAFSVDGKLYQLTTGFEVGTLAGKASVVGNDPGWTVEDAMKLAEAYPDSSLLDMMTRDELLRNYMAYAGYQFINEREATCDFNSPEFIRLLEWVSTFPATIDWEDFTGDFWMEHENAYRNNKVLLQTSHLASFHDFKYMRSSGFGEKVTYIGYPTSEGNGAVMMPLTTYAISARSQCKEGAWQFIRSFLLDEYQTSSDMWVFPVKISALEAAGAAAMKPFTYIDDLGNEVVVQDSYWIGDQEIIIEPLSQTEIDEAIAYLKTVTRLSDFNIDVYNIIAEEAASFFSGQKKAADVAAIIQSRARIVLGENS